MMHKTHMDRLLRKRTVTILSFLQWIILPFAAYDYISRDSVITFIVINTIVSTVAVASSIILFRKYKTSNITLIITNIMIMMLAYITVYFHQLLIGAAAEFYG